MAISEHCSFCWKPEDEYGGREKRSLDVFLLQLISLGCKSLYQECMHTAGFMKIKNFPNTFPAGPAETLVGSPRGSGLRSMASACWAINKGSQTNVTFTPEGSLDEGNLHPLFTCSGFELVTQGWKAFCPSASTLTCSAVTINIPQIPWSSQQLQP